MENHLFSNCGSWDHMSSFCKWV